MPAYGGTPLGRRLTGTLGGSIYDTFPTLARVRGWGRGGALAGVALPPVSAHPTPAPPSGGMREASRTARARASERPCPPAPPDCSG